MALSHGPKTPTGKLRSAGNRVTHGLYYVQVILKSGTQQEFDTLRPEPYLSALHVGPGGLLQARKNKKIYHSNPLNEIFIHNLTKLSSNTCKDFEAKKLHPDAPGKRFSFALKHHPEPPKRCHSDDFLQGPAVLSG